MIDELVVLICACCRCGKHRGYFIKPGAVKERSISYRFVRILSLSTSQVSWAAFCFRLHQKKWTWQALSLPAIHTDTCYTRWVHQAQVLPAQHRYHKTSAHNLFGHLKTRQWRLHHTGCQDRLPTNVPAWFEKQHWLVQIFCSSTTCNSVPELTLSTGAVPHSRGSEFKIVEIRVGSRFRLLYPCWKCGWEEIVQHRDRR